MRERRFILPASNVARRAMGHAFKSRTYFTPFALRKWANRRLKHVVYEDENTRYVDIGPVNKVFNCLCRYFSGDAEGVEKHMPRFWDYLWVAEDGMKMQGYNGSQLWDCGVCGSSD